MSIGEIKVQNNAQGVLEIDIDGVIGVPEWYQFDSSEDKVDCDLLSKLYL